MAGKTDDKDPDLASELKESAHRIWLAGLGALAVAEEEGSKLFRTLVERGEEMETRGREGVKEAGGRARKRAATAWDSLEEGFESRVGSVLQHLGVPTRAELEELSRRVEELTAALEKARRPSRGGARKTTRKTGPRRT